MPKSKSNLSPNSINNNLLNDIFHPVTDKKTLLNPELTLKGKQLNTLWQLESQQDYNPTLASQKNIGDTRDRLKAKNLLENAPLTGSELALIELFYQNLTFQHATNLFVKNSTITLYSPRERLRQGETISNQRSPTHNGRDDYIYFVTGIGNRHPNTPTIADEQFISVSFKKMNKYVPEVLNNFIVAPHFSDFHHNTHACPVELSGTYVDLYFKDEDKTINYYFEYSDGNTKTVTYTFNDFVFYGKDIPYGLALRLFELLHHVGNEYRNSFFEKMHSVKLTEEEKIKVLSETMTALMPGWMNIEAKVAKTFVVDQRYCDYIEHKVDPIYEESLKNQLQEYVDFIESKLSDDEYKSNMLFRKFAPLLTLKESFSKIDPTWSTKNEDVFYNCSEEHIFVKINNKLSDEFNKLKEPEKTLLTNKSIREFDIYLSDAFKAGINSLFTEPNLTQQKIENIIRHMMIGYQSIVEAPALGFPKADILDAIKRMYLTGNYIRDQNVFFNALNEVFERNKIHPVVKFFLSFKYQSSYNADINYLVNLQQRLQGNLYPILPIYSNFAYSNSALGGWYENINNTRSKYDYIKTLAIYFFSLSKRKDYTLNRELQEIQAYFLQDIRTNEPTSKYRDIAQSYIELCNFLYCYRGNLDKLTEDDKLILVTNFTSLDFFHINDLIINGFDINTQVDYLGKKITPLYMAIVAGCPLHVIKFIINKGADLSLVKSCLEPMPDKSELDDYFLFNYGDDIQENVINYLADLELTISPSETTNWNHNYYKKHQSNSQKKAVIVIVTQENELGNKFLMGRRRLYTASGYYYLEERYSFPGGLCEDNESYTDAALRELKEETHINATIQEGVESSLIFEGIKLDTEYEDEEELIIGIMHIKLPQDAKFSAFSGSDFYDVIKIKENMIYKNMDGNPSYFSPSHKNTLPIRKSNYLMLKAVQNNDFSEDMKLTIQQFLTVESKNPDEMMPNELAELRV